MGSLEDSPDSDPARPHHSSTSRTVVPAISLVLVSLGLTLSLAPSCSSNAATPACQLGEEGCDCRADKSCDGELSCLSGLCVDYGSGAAGEGGGAGANGDAASDSGGGSGGASRGSGALGGSSGSSGSGGSGGVDAGGGSSGGGSSGGGSSGGGSSGGGSSGGGGYGAAPAGTPVDRIGKLSVRDGKLRGQSGTPVQLRGMSGFWTNWLDWHPEQNTEALRWLRDYWDLSVIRVSMGVGPEEGGYLDDPNANRAAVQRSVDAAIDLGLYVIVDWHDHVAHTHQSEAEAFFEELSEQYGAYPNVIYEPYNEPLDTALWSSDVKPYHEAVISVIRAMDADNVILLGSPTWSQDVDVATSDPVAGDNLMYTLHFYSCSHGEALRAKADLALAAGAALFVSEWGTTLADGGGGDWVCETEAQAWHDWMDANDISWAAWSLCREPEVSCIANDDASESGGWDQDLKGHGPFVRDRLQQRGNDCTNDRIIDTLEDLDAEICDVGGRRGSWFLSNDGTGSQSPATQEDIAATLSPARGYSTVAAHTSGSGFADWGALIGVLLNNGPSGLEYFDASRHQGLRFHVRGSGTVVLRVATGSTTPSPEGYCASNDCYEHFGITLDLGDEWVPYLVPFDWLESQTLLTMTAQDRRELLTVEFNASSSSFDLWIDDLGFY